VEAGGILIGYYTTDRRTAVITEASLPPPDSRRGATWFDRGILGLRQLLAKRWGNSPRRHYIGEWHYHPSVWVEPSALDHAQMFDIAAATAYDCAAPVMLLAGMGALDDRPLRVFVFPKGKEMLTLVPGLDQGGCAPLGNCLSGSVGDDKNAPSTKQCSTP
jgi:integrative and conjugative element protein (TIGR02256 family)